MGAGPTEGGAPGLHFANHLYDAEVSIQEDSVHGEAHEEGVDGATGRDVERFAVRQSLASHESPEPGPGAARDSHVVSDNGALSLIEYLRHGRISMRMIGCTAEL